MPSYNQGQYLEAAITSIIDQDYSNIELIIIDGGSEDETVPILEKFTDRIAFWCSEPDSGQSDALNKGFGMVSGDIVGWLNSDDTYQPGTFHAVAEVFSDEKINIAMCHEFGMMDPQGNTFDYKRNSYDDHHTLIRYWATNGMTINQPSVFFRRKLLEPFDPVLDTSLHYAMDYDLWLRMTQSHQVHVVNGHWANYRFHEASKSGKSFDDFFPEWYRVSQRFWGKKYSVQWWLFWGQHFFHRHIKRPVRAVLLKLKSLISGT